MTMIECAVAVCIGILAARLLVTPVFWGVLFAGLVYILVLGLPVVIVGYGVYLFATEPDPGLYPKISTAVLGVVVAGFILQAFERVGDAPRDLSS